MLPALAVACICVWVVALAVLSLVRASIPIDSPENRRSVEQALAAIDTMRPASPDDAALRRALDEMLAQPHVATIWLLGPDGRILLSRGATAASTPVGSTVEELATNDARRLLDALPPGALTGEQSTWLLAASAFRREGTHNDVYRHLLRPIAGTDGSPVAIVGVAYDHSAWSPGVGWKAGVLLSGLSLLLYWLSLPLWVLLDAQERGERAAAWAVFVLFGNLVALIAYLLARSPAREPVTGEAIAAGG
jgi:hypothetical protein